MAYATLVQLTLPVLMRWQMTRTLKLETLPMEYAASTFFVFVRLRYFTQLKSWFFTLAHEIAHNLVQQHDAEVCDNLPKSHNFQS